jgi:hypothetical protein
MTERKLVAVAMRKNGELASHAGRALLWVVYDVCPGSDPFEAYRITLNARSCLHEWNPRSGGDRHPLHAVNIAIAGSGGEGVQRRLAAYNTSLILTAEKDISVAVAGYLAGSLASAMPHDEHDCHGDDHTHVVTGTALAD